jgi:hypothetical protein
VESKGLQQDRVHHAENRGDGAYAQSYGQEGGQGKSRRLAQGANAHSKIQEQGLHGISLRHLPDKAGTFPANASREHEQSFQSIAVIGFPEMVPLVRNREEGVRK